MVHLWLREETKPLEYRTCLSPAGVQTLLAHGFQVTVERSAQRIFDIAEYAALPGVTIAEAGAWQTPGAVPQDAYIVGLKELPEGDTSPLPHAHIMFAHCFKNQGGWRDVLGRFTRGDGLLLDLEFLNDKNGRRVAAFGFYAGFAGAAAGVKAWIAQQQQQQQQNADGAAGTLGGLEPYPNEQALVSELSASLKDAVAANGGRHPRVIVIGALGRCGSGAVDLARKVGIPDECISKWDMAETARGGPFPEITEHDIFVNCIYLSSQIAPFLTPAMIASDAPAASARRLSVVVDVSCDTTNPFNPIPIYSVNTTFDRPTVRVAAGDAARGVRPVDVCSIDHLPSLLPREASEQFCADLMPTLLQLADRASSQTWRDAEQLYREKASLL